MDILPKVFEFILTMSLCACAIIPVVLFLRLMLKKAPKWINVLLWGIVALSLIVAPFFAILYNQNNNTSSPPVPEEPDNGYEDNLPFKNINPPEYDIVSPGTSLPQNGADTISLKEILDAIMRLFQFVTNKVADFTGSLKSPWPEILSGVWSVGVASMLAYTTVSYWRLRRKVATAVRLIENIYQSENVGFPFVLGFFKPRIYLPFKINLQDLEHVIAHEQAHIRRKDHWWKPLGFLLLTILWFNPLIWLAYILLCRDIELACDERVIRDLGSEQKADYTQALVTCSIKRHTVTACPLAFGAVGVKDRVKAVMNYKKPTVWIKLVSVTACIVVAIFSLTLAIFAALAMPDLEEPKSDVIEPTLPYPTPPDPTPPDPTNLVYYPVLGGGLLFDPTTGTITGLMGNPSKFEFPAEIDGVPVVAIADGKTTLSIPRGTVYYPVLGGGLLFDPATGTIVGYIGSPSKIVIPSEIDGVAVEAIDNGAFRFCASLTSVTMPEGMKTIGAFAFAHCANLRYVKLPDSVKSIGRLAFRLCESLTGIDLPEGLESIGNEAFAYSSLTDITIPKSVESMGFGVFSMCSNLKAIWVDEDNPNYSSDENGVLFNKDQTELHTYPAALRGSYMVPSGVTKIGPYAFSGSSLTRINLLDGVTVIGTAAFNHCSNLTQITLPYGMAAIDNSAFAKCSSLTSIAIPASTTSFGSSVFSGCNNLKGIHFSGTEAQWERLTNGTHNYNGAIIYYNAV